MIFARVCDIVFCFNHPCTSLVAMPRGIFGAGAGAKVAMVAVVDAVIHSCVCQNRGSIAHILVVGIDLMWSQQISWCSGRFGAFVS